VGLLCETGRWITGMSKNVSIMISGGLDSYIMDRYATVNGFNSTLIYVNLGHPYVESEKKAIKIAGFDAIEINMEALYPAIEKRLSNQIIPSRNMLFAVVGSMFNPRVWLGALDGEQHGKEHDKSRRFFDDASSLLSYTNEFFQAETIIETPFSHLTKAGTIEWALSTGGISKEDLLRTSSCYSGHETPCGVCLTCYKRWAAFLLNDIVETGHEANPWESDYAKEMAQEIPKAHKAGDHSRFTPSRIDEWFDVREKMKTLGIS
jgi:7-cyano-7-deazaguanine synthase in queuosine biosynthesis